MIRRETFLRSIRVGAFAGKMDDAQVLGCMFLLEIWMARPYGCDRCLAYSLATATWETETTMQPVARGAPERYCGRGYLPVGGETFYNRASALCGIDLVAEPERLEQPKVAAKVLFAGLAAGIFTGTPLTDFLNADTVDWEAARSAASSTDDAAKVAALACTYWVALQGASVRPDDVRLALGRPLGLR